MSATLNSTGEGGGEGEKEVRSPPNQSFDEDHLPSSSKQLVENLIRENTKLKHQVHNPQKLDELNLVGYISAEKYHQYLGLGI